MTAPGQQCGCCGVTTRLLRAVEHAIENELDGFTTEQIRDMRGYVAETLAWRLSRDGYLAQDINAEYRPEFADRVCVDCGRRGPLEYVVVHEGRDHIETWWPTSHDGRGWSHPPCAMARQ